ncbi:MAG: Fic family protein [Bacteroidales bacterium]|nr:Fic family protein [Bacteroidales bacterium]
MIEKAPDIDNALIIKAMSLLERNDIKALANEINDLYLYWSDVKYKKVPDNVSTTDLWACVKLNRALQRVTVWKDYGISFAITNKMQRLCHDFDMNFGGSWGNSTHIPDESKERYLISSLMEEAISSSQMEGASTTRKIAKEMLRKNISPRSRSEQMIHNNYNSIRFIVQNKDTPLTKEHLLKVHALMTYKTLDNSQDEGKFRDNNEIVVENSITHEVVHTPPCHTKIPSFIDSLCKFFNEKNGKGIFIHPIIRAIIIHFMIAYIHPFVDGNGRTARALFYWYMLKQGYWLTEYLSISRVIYKSKESYEKAYLYTEADNNDIGYFIAYNLRVLELAFKELQIYIERKTAQQQQTSDYLKLGGINERQAAILSLLDKKPKLVLTIKELQNRFAISHPTAKLDVDPLVERGFLEKIPVNKVKFNYIRGKNFDSLIKEKNDKHILN